MRTIGATALSPTAAVAELVANSLDARVEGCLVKIEVRLLEGRIEIIDDARGMTLQVLSDALRLGVDMNQHGGTRQGRMGTYGLGLKTAAASLGDVWGLVTRPAEPERPVEFRTRFDLQEWSARGSSARDWTAELQEGEPDTSGPLGGRRHGTAIWVERLRFKDHLPGAYLDHLSRAFAPFLKQGHKIVVNNQEVVLRQPSLVENTRVEFDRLVDETRGWRVRGWMGLDTRTHNDGYYGLDLYKNDQLIEMHNKDFFKAHLMTSRILGEVHLDFVPVNFNKVDFSKGTEEWKFARETMRELLKPVAEASRIMSRGRHDDTRGAKAAAKLEEAFRGPTGFVEAERDSVVGGGSAGDVLGAENPVRTQAGIELRASGKTLWLPRGPVHLDAQLEELSSRLTPWDYITEANGTQLLVVVNTESATFKKMKDVDLLSCIAVADCISRFLIEREQVDPRKARRVCNEWLHEAVTGQSIWQQNESSTNTGMVES